MFGIKEKIAVSVRRRISDRDRRTRLIPGPGRRQHSGAADPDVAPAESIGLSVVSIESREGHGVATDPPVVRTIRIGLPDVDPPDSHDAATVSKAALS